MSKFFPIKLREGDIVIVETLLGINNGEYTVYKVEGNRAYTKFRTFNVNVRYDGKVSEFGKRYRSDWTANSYFLKK